MSEVKKTKVHLISGFLGTGKTTALKSLMAQKDPNEKWVIIVNEFGEIGIDGAVLERQRYSRGRNCRRLFVLYCRRANGYDRTKNAARCPTRPLDD